MATDLQLVQDIKSIFRKRTIFLKEEYKPILDEFLEILIELYSFVIIVKKTTIQEILNQEQVLEINQQKEKTYENLREIIDKLLRKTRI